MINITDAAALSRALERPLAPDMQHLLVLRRDQLLTDHDGDNDIGTRMQFIVVEPPDTVAEIEAAACYPLVTEASFEWVKDHGRLFEAVTILSDDGFGVVLIVPDDDQITPQLITLLRELAPSDQPVRATRNHGSAPTAP